MIALIAAGWIGCGVLAFGTLTADWHWFVLDLQRIYTTPTFDLKREMRDSLGIRVVISSLGPLGLILSAIISNFWAHGWRLR